MRMARNANWRVLWLILLLCLPAASAQSGQPIGDWESRFELSLQRVLSGGPPAYSPEFVLADAVPRHVRRFTNYSGDVSGRYIDALSAAARSLGLQPFPALQQVLQGLMPLQKPDGHFGDPLSQSGVQDNDMAMMWGNGRLLIGLMEYHRLTQSPEVLAAARRIGDFLVTAAPVFNSETVRQAFSEGKFAVGYICWTQHIEGLVELYRRTRDARYLELARQMADRTRREPLQHSHGFLASLRGILELYRVTGDRQCLELVQREWTGILETGNRLASGAIPERLDDTAHRTEGCSEADWLRLNLELWAETRLNRYLEEAELVLFNEFSFNQFDTGDFGHYDFFPSKHSEFKPPLSPVGYGQQSARAWWCCTLHGLRAFPEVLKHSLRREGSVLFVDLPADGRIADEGLEVRADSTFSRDASVRIRVRGTSPAITAIDVREPEWADGVEAAQSGLRLQGVRAGNRVRFPVSRSDGAELAVTWNLVTRQEVRDTPGGLYVSFRHGPYLLAVDELASPFFFDEPYTDNIILVPADPRVALEPAPVGAVPGRLGVPVGRFRLPYQPGGYSESTAQATLRPLAERTSVSGPAAWVFWFRSAGRANPK